jgi:hypothetical protein
MKFGVQLLLAAVSGVIIGAVITDAVNEAEANRLAEQNHREGFRQGVRMADGVVNDCLAKNGVPAKVILSSTIAGGLALVRAVIAPTDEYYRQQSA